jgi:hypothetical protein
MKLKDVIANLSAADRQSRFMSFYDPRTLVADMVKLMLSLQNTTKSQSVICCFAIALDLEMAV